MTTPRDCRPPEGTPDGTRHRLTWGGGSVITTIPAVWRDGAWDWPYTSPGGQNRYTPDELSRAGWRLAEPPHGQ